jgi:hypothetical protein
MMLPIPLAVVPVPADHSGVLAGALVLVATLAVTVAGYVVARLLGGQS